jgi:rod shape determining protein RodA
MLKILKHIDWLLLGSAVFITIVGIINMSSFTGEGDFSERQIIWLLLSLVVFFGASVIDWRFLRRTTAVSSIFLLSFILLLLLFVVGSIFKGAQSWFNLGAFAFQPTDLAKLALILVLAKYFARRHVEIAHVRHIIVSGLYAFIIFTLVFLQPDFGSAVIVAMIWLGMVLVSGISKKHLLIVFATGAVSIFLLWTFVFQDYQKQRIVSFLNPLADIRGAGYNAYQSTIAVGSGELLGKGIGYGTQSKLKFLPEYRTDFIFAAFAEEWGFVGVLLLFALYGMVLWRILSVAYRGETNFEILYGLGISIFFVSHFIVHVGMNIGLLPVTGITLPLMSYGGSHLIAEFLSLGVLAGMRNYARATHKETIKNELVQVSGSRDLYSE